MPQDEPRRHPQTRVAYVVLSHAFPELVLRLSQAIHRSSPRARVVVHHDERACRPPPALGPWMLVHTHRAEADWGSWELAMQTCAALVRAREATGADLLVLISGQDYPARSLADWEREFFARGGGWQGEARVLEYLPRWGRPHGRGDDDLTRYTYVWWTLPWGRWMSRSPSPAAEAIRAGLFTLAQYAEPLLDVRNLVRGRGIHIGLRNPFPPFRRGFRCVKGSQWLALEASLLDEFIQVHGTRRWLRWCYRHSVIPDESYLQSILRSLRPPNDPPITYVEWSTELDRPRPLTLQDLQTVRASSSPFCRKVEIGVSVSLMQALDRLTDSGTA